MATKKPAKAKSAKGSDGFSAEEKAAMKERARELKADKAKANGEAEVLAKISKMPEPDRSIAERLHALITTTAPELSPRTWYGMPAYAKDGNVICFFQNRNMFKARYGTLGFSDKAKLDDGEMWPSSFALTQLTPAAEKRIAALVKKAVS